MTFRFEEYQDTLLQLIHEKLLLPSFLDTMNSTSKITIRCPKFEQFEFVVLHWNDQEHRTKIVQRWLDLDDGDGCWWYETTVKQSRLFPEGVFEHRE